MIPRNIVLMCMFLLGLASLTVSNRNVFFNPLDGLNLLQLQNYPNAMSNSKVLVDVHVHEGVILSDFHLEQLNRIVFGSASSDTMNVVSGTENRVFRTRLSLKRIEEIRRNEMNYKKYIHTIERVTNEKRMHFPQFSMDSLRFSKIRVVMSGESEKQLPVFLSKINTKFSHEFASQLIESSVRRSPESIDNILSTSSIMIEEKGRMFSISLNNNDAHLWNYNEKRNPLVSHMSDFLLGNILDNEDVDYIEREYTQSLLSFGTNEVVQNNRKLNVSRFAWDNGVTGKGETVQIIDSGLDYSHCYFSSPNEEYSTLNNKNRKIILYERGKTGDRIDGNGHGTHCSGIIAGNPGSSSGIDQDVGVAKDAKIHMVDAAISILFSVDNMTTYLTNGYASGARVSSNSWGNTNNLDCLFDCDCYEAKSNYSKKVKDEYCSQQYGLRCCQIGNTYETLSAQVDDFTNLNDEMVVVFAAGNSGYYGQDKSIISPATAKNCIAVGAAYATSEEYTRYNPSTNTSLYNHDNLGYFSARGPTVDNRFKPDIVAPGVAIWSSRAYIPFCDSTGLIQKTGTSMACPAVSGVAALVREYFVQNNKQRLIKYDLINKSDSQTLSGMLVKAFIIHSGEKLMGTVKLDGVFTNGNQNNYDLSKENSPNKFTGYGRVNIANTMKFSDNDQNPDLFTINRQKIYPSSNITISMKMSNSSNPLKVTLTWYDLKGTPMSSSNKVVSKQLINDLDLLVSIRDDSTSQITTLCYGNQPCTYGQIQDSSLIDDRNSVESLTINPSLSDTNSSSPLTITITIKASEKNVGSQKFALLISGYNIQVSSLQIPPEPLLSEAVRHYSSKSIYFMVVIVMLFLIVC